jgi:hypothetical protein
LFLAIGALTFLPGLSVGSASARSSTQGVAHSKVAAASRSNNDDHWIVRTKSSPRSTKRYFIEFRARSAASYGHMYVLYGRVNSRHEMVETRIAGLHPAGDAANCYNCSLFNWTIGHVIPVPSETGASDGDLEEKYVTARYRVWLDKAQYKAIDAYIRKLQADSPTWNALWNNCVDFGRDIAEHLGLKVPAFIWLEPKDFVTELRKMNGVAKEQLPLKDASNGLRSTTIRAIAKHAPKHEAHVDASRKEDAPRKQTVASGTTH